MIKYLSKYRNVAIIVLCAVILQLFPRTNIFAARVLWPSEMNMQNDSINLDEILPKTATSSGSKKGFLFTGDPKEIFILGAGHIAINVTLSGKGHTYLQLLHGLKKRNINITLVVCNDKAPIGINTTDAPAEFQNPHFYMMDFLSTNNGEWQRYNFDRLVDDYGEYVDNWIIGNEINSQAYNYYGPADVEEYTKVYCDTYKICYDKIHEKNPDADVYISFDQGWDIPQQRKDNSSYNSFTSKYRYNAIEQLNLINKYLNKNIDWGIALHPYPSPLSSAKFWDDEYAGYNDATTYDKERPCYLVLKNLDYAVTFMAKHQFLKPDGNVRNIIVSEFGVTSNNGEMMQAAGLYFLWEKTRDNPFIKFLLYYSELDLDDFHFGLSDQNGKKRLAWAVFKDMDKDDENAWCKDLLDDILKDTNYADVNGMLITRASLSELIANSTEDSSNPNP